MVWKGLLGVTLNEKCYIPQMELDSLLGLMLLRLENVTKASLASHTTCREQGSGHTAIIQSLPRNTIIGQSADIR